MKLATDEQILKTYNYATVGKVSDTLTITNRRIIVSTEGKLQDGSKVHTTDEMMLNSIEKISGSLITKRSPVYIVLALIMLIASAVLYFVIKNYLSFIPVLPALIFIIVFFTNKKKSFYLVLTSSLREGMDLSVSVGNWQRKKSKKALKVNVDEAHASEIIDEIGSIIVEAKN